MEIHPMITISPQSVNTTVGVNATFTCAGINGLFILWVINGLVSGNVVNINRGIQIHKENKQDVLYSYLTVPATPSNNNISIKCAILSSTKSDGYTTPVTLLIQGKLEGVTDLDVFQLNSSSILVSFTPPFTLEGVPISNYSIEVLDDSNSGPLVYTVSQSNSLVIELTDPCLNYTCAVSAWNDVGQGYVETLAFVLHQVPDVPDNVTASVVFPSYSTLANLVPLVVLSFTTLTSCIGKVPDYITVYQLDKTLQPSSIIHIESTTNHSCSCDVVEVTINISSYVSYGNHYLMAAKYSNNIGYSSISSEISISTFLVSDAMLYIYQQHDNSSVVCLQCIFIHSPPSIFPPLSCKAIFIDDNNVLPNKSMVVPYNKQFNVVCDTSFRPGQYTVYVYDSFYLNNPAIHSLNATVPPHYNDPEDINVSTYTTTAILSTSELSNTTKSTTATTLATTTTTTITTTNRVTIETTLSNPSNSLSHSSTNAVIMSLVGSLCALIAIIMVLIVFLGACKVYYKQQFIAKMKQVQKNCDESSAQHSTADTVINDHSIGPIYDRVNDSTLGQTVSSQFHNSSGCRLSTIAPRSTRNEALEMTKCPAYATHTTVWQTERTLTDQDQ